MGHYRSNVRDLQFTLFDVLGADRSYGTGPFAEFDVETARDVLTQVERLASGPLAESYTESDRHPPVYDAATCSVTMPEPFRRSFQMYLDAEWWRLDIPAEAGGAPAPRSLWWALVELVQGANPAVYMFGGGPSFGGLLTRSVRPSSSGSPK